MEIFNVHLFELLLIAGLALVVFGPERLPEVGRFAGKQVARFLAWQQQSPELKIINDVRADIEQEIASLRDELVRTRKQLDLSQEANLNSIRDELRPMLNLRDQPKGAPANAPSPGPAPSIEAGAPPRTWDPPVDDDAASIDESIFDLVDDPTAEAAPAQHEADPTLPRPPEGTAQATARPNRLAATEPTSVLDRPDDRLGYLDGRRRSLHDAPADDPPAAPALNGQRPASAAPARSAAEVALLMRQLESLSADLQTLISGLQAQGVIGADWQPDAAVSEQESLSQ